MVSFLFFIGVFSHNNEHIIWVLRFVVLDFDINSKCKEKEKVSTIILILSVPHKIVTKLIYLLVEQILHIFGTAASVFLMFVHE